MTGRFYAIVGVYHYLTFTNCISRIALVFKLRAQSNGFLSYCLFYIQFVSKNTCTTIFLSLE